MDFFLGENLFNRLQIVQFECPRVRNPFVSKSYWSLWRVRFSKFQPPPLFTFFRAPFRAPSYRNEFLNSVKLRKNVEKSCLTLGATKSASCDLIYGKVRLMNIALGRTRSGNHATGFLHVSVTYYRRTFYTRHRYEASVLMGR